MLWTISGKIIRIVSAARFRQRDGWYSSALHTNTFQTSSLVASNG